MLLAYQYKDAQETKRWKKIVAFLLVFAIVFGTLIELLSRTAMAQERLEVNALLSDYTEDIVDTAKVASIDKAVMKEDPNIIALKNRDGSNTAYIFSEPVAFQEEDGSFHAKSTSIQKVREKEQRANGFDYENGANDIRFQFSKDPSTGIRLSADNWSYQLSPLGGDEHAVGEKGSVLHMDEEIEAFQYKDYYGKGTTLNYYPDLNGVKEEIILQEPSDRTEYEFLLKTTNAEAALQKDGSIQIIDLKTQEASQTIRAPFAYDASYLGDDPEDTIHFSPATFSLSKPEPAGEGETIYHLSVNVDKDWLGADSTTYPVTIDPNTSTLSNYFDTGIYSAKGGTNYGTSATACFGRASAYGYGRVLAFFVPPSDITSSTTINSAYYWFRETTGRTTNTYVTPYIVTSVWLESSVTWNNKPSYNANSAQQQKCINGNSSDSSTSKHLYRFNITNAVTAWKNGTTNRGLVFISNEETNGAYNWRAFATKEYSTSSYRPYAVINYTNDTTPPTYTNITGNAVNWTNQNVTLSVNGAADSESGLASEAYSFSNSASTNYWQTSNQKTFSSNQTVYIKIRDAVGNIKDCGSVAITKIDKTKPSITSVTGTPSSWTNDPYTLTVTASDNASSISGYSFSATNEPGTWQSSNQKTMTEGGTIYVFAKDGAGNISDATVLTNIMCDPDEPIIDAINTYTSSQSGLVGIEIVAHDDGSGIAGYSFDGGTTWQSTNTASVSVDDMITAQFAVKDNVGNIAYGDASESVPMFYMDGQLVGLGHPAGGTSGIEYKIGENGTWNEYTWPFAIPAFTTTRIYARLEDGGTVVSKDYTSLSKYYGSYSESNTDFSLSYRGVSYDFVRSYDSGDNKWFFGTDATVKQLTSAAFSATLPDGTEESFIRNGRWTYVNQRTEDTLTIEKDAVLEPTGYTVKVDDTYYAYSLEGRLTGITNKYGDEILLSWTKRSGSNTGTLADYSSVDIHDGTTNGTRHYVVAIDSSGKVTSITDPANNTIDYTYNAVGNLIEVTDQAGVTIGDYSYTETSSGSGLYRMTKSMDKSIQYNSAGRVTKELWDSGAYTNYTYDDTTLTVSTASSNTETTTTTYNDAFFVVSDTDAQGETKTYTYNDLYQVTSETVGNKTTTYQYDTEGNLTKTVEEDGKQTIYSYNGSDQLIKEASEDGTTYYVYYGANENGGAEGDLKLSASLKKSYTGTEPSAYDPTLTCFETITYTYDNGLVLETVDSLNSETTTYVYDQYGNPSQTSVIKVITDENNNQSTSLTVTTATYDLFNRTLTSSTATNSSNIENSSTIYDAAGRTLKSDIKSDVTRTRYDSLGRVIQEIGPDDYDATLDGLPNADTYSNSTAGSTYVYSADNTLASETNRLGKTTNYYYNSSGNKIREEFDIYKFYYRDHGELTEVKVNDVTKVTYNYNGSTNLLQSTVYANGDTIYYTYDANNNLVAERRNNESSPYVTYTYNTDNELTLKTDYDNDIEYSYGTNGSVSVMRVSDDFVLQDYSESSNEDEVDSEDDVINTINEHRYGRSITSSVTNHSYAITVDSVGTANYSFTNNAKNNVASEEVRFNTNANAFSTAYTYDSNDNITNKTVALGSNVSLSFVNTYDAKNRITSSSLGNNGQAYSYDQYGQLTQVVDSANEFTESYTYDSRGNILSKNKVYDDVNTPAETTSFTYGNNAWQDELTAVNGTSLTYDANGNVLSYGTKTFTWKNGRVLSNITDSGTNTSISYSYDENGIRLSKTVNGTTTWYTVKDGVILSQTTGGNTMFFQYDNSGNPLGFVRYDTQYFYITNQMGDVVGITDTTGNLIATYSYGAWGEVLAVTPATAGNTTQLAIANDNPLRYRGYYYDAETSYYYLQSRYYDPEICRFVNADEYVMVQESRDSFCGYNSFVYGGNAPTSNYDYTGKVLPAVVIKAIGKMLGGIIFQYAQDIIYNVINLGKNATWNKALKRRSAVYVYVSAALSAMIPGSKAYRNAASAGLNALATTFESYAKNKAKITKKNLPSYILKFILDFGFNYICERLTRSFDVQLKNLKPAQVKTFKGNPLIKKGVNSFRTTHALMVNKTKNYLSTHHSMITNWGNAIVQAVNKKYG